MRVETINLDLPALVGAFSQRLHDAGLPVTPARSADMARALDLTRPVTRRRLYWTLRSIVVTDPTQVPVFDAVFFGLAVSRATTSPFTGSSMTMTPGTDSETARVVSVLALLTTRISSGTRVCASRE